MGKSREFPDPSASNPPLERELAEVSHFSTIEEVGSLAELSARINDYKERLREADRVLVILGCDDARVTAPSKAFDFKDNDGSSRSVMAVYIPTIGGGAPSPQRIESILETLESFEIPAEKISVVATQHGGTAELATFAQEDIRPQCGLRAFWKDHRALMQFFKGRTRRLSDSIDQLFLMSQQQLMEQINRIFFNDEELQRPAITDVATFDNLINSYTELLRAGFSPRFILNAALRNGDSSIDANAASVLETIHSYDLGVKICAGNINHENATLQIPGLDEIKLNLVSDHPEDMTYQNPSVIVLKFGPLASTIHSAVFFPESVGEDTTDNDFTGSGTALSAEGCLRVIAEGWYAARNHWLHGINPADAHGNFEHLQGVQVVCDDERYVDLVIQAFTSFEFRQYYQQQYAVINGGRVEILNLKTGETIPIYIRN